jgi:ABC-type polysaccharide/polyol phosphate export permease
MLKNFLKNVIHYRDLIGHLVFFDLKSNVARTYFGIIWWIIDPILYMLVFYFLIEIILHRGGPNYSAFLFTALIPLKWTMSSLVDSTSTITSKVSILNQIYVPKYIFVITSLGINTVKFSIGLVLLLLFLWFYGINFSMYILYLPLIIVIHGLFIFGTMLIFAHMGIYFNDLKNMMQYFTRMLYYLSPVLFSMDSLPKKLSMLLYLNPLTTLFESYRNIFMYNEPPQFIGLFCLLIIAVIMIIVGISIMEKYDKRYIKVI